jgi:phosphotriesterase-related protein
MSSKVVITVCGDLAPENLGAVLPHEHLLCDFTLTGGKPEDRISDWTEIPAELEIFKQAGGGAIFELTPLGLGDDPQALRCISTAAQVPIVRGISFYVEETYPKWVWSATPQAIADFFVKHIEEGEGEVRAGLIGEVTSHNEPLPDAGAYRLHDCETKVFCAAAQAQSRTGVAITTHAALGRGGHAQLDTLERAGADLSRVVIGHCDAHGQSEEERDMEYYLPILDRGAYVEFDLIGGSHSWPGCMTDELRAHRLASLIRQGYARQLLLSTDTCRRSQLWCRGGRGFGYLWTHFLPLLRAQGVSENYIRTMLVQNPRRVATLV